MLVYNLLFYIFSIFLIGSSFGVVSARNSVYAVLFLILAFINVAALFLLLGAEFLAMSIVIVYVGAVAVLFLFVVMMLDLKSVNIQIKDRKKYNKKWLFVLGLLLLVEIIIVIYISCRYQVSTLSAKMPMILDGVKTNTAQIGEVLYTNYAYLFEICGVILFVAIISAITLTCSDSKNAKKQNVEEQIRRNKANSMKLVAVKTGEGVDAIIK